LHNVQEPPVAATSFLHETLTYAGQARRFTRTDVRTYAAWIGLMLGLLGSVSGFLFVGHQAGVTYPAYVWNIPLGTAIFVAAIAFDTIGHLTTYKEELAKGEALVHQITITAGVSSVVVLCLAYSAPDFLRIPALVLTLLSVMYSVIDEALHWRRYLSLKCDRVESFSHFFIFVGHGIMMLAWWTWFDAGYPGVRETLVALRRLV
jgi:hypothetical protein